MHPADLKFLLGLFVLGGLLVCLLLGSVGKGIGTTYRGQPMAGFWLGFLLGPLGWLAIFGLDDLRLRCPECGGVVSEGARRCSHCAVSFSQ